MRGNDEDDARKIIRDVVVIPAPGGDPGKDSRLAACLGNRMLSKTLAHITCAASLALCMHAVPAANLAGVDLRPSLPSRAGSLALASCGVKKTLAVNHYVSALYVPRNGSI